MNNVRKIKKIYKSIPTVEGAGVRLKRAFGFSHAPDLDPFLLLDDFHSDNPDHYTPGFPWHPHRGIETITYMVEGEVEHGDSMGNRGTIRPGDVQWMTAGSGIVHQEMPHGDDRGRMWGFQLWANLPAKSKMMDPRYREVMSADIPETVMDSGARVKIICGEVSGTKGPVRDIVIDPLYLDVSVPPRSSFSLPVAGDRTAIAYVIDGEASFDRGDDTYAYEVEGSRYFDIRRERLLRPENLILFDSGDGIIVETEESSARFLLIAGKPIGEPVAWYGPIVMNTQEELRVAFDEFRAGTFVKFKG